MEQTKTQEENKSLPIEDAKLFLLAYMDKKQDYKYSSDYIAEIMVAYRNLPNDGLHKLILSFVNTFIRAGDCPLTRDIVVTLQRTFELNTKK